MFGQEPGDFNNTKLMLQDKNDKNYERFLVVEELDFKSFLINSSCQYLISYYDTSGNIKTFVVESSDTDNKTVHCVDSLGEKHSVAIDKIDKIYKVYVKKEGMAADTDSRIEEKQQQIEDDPKYSEPIEKETQYLVPECETTVYYKQDDPNVVIQLPSQPREKRAFLCNFNICFNSGPKTKILVLLLLFLILVGGIITSKLYHLLNLSKNQGGQSPYFIPTKEYICLI